MFAVRAGIFFLPASGCCVSDFGSTEVVRISALKGQGKTLEEIVAEKPTAEFDAEWGNGFFSPDQWIKAVYPTM